MWEAIASNRRRSIVLIALMGMLLVAVGAAIGFYYSPRADAPIIGAGVALAVWFLLWTSAIAAGDSLILAAAGAHPIGKDEAPVLWNVVEEMTIAAGLPKMPTIYLVEDDAPNAFAVGRNQDNASVAVTSGLLMRMNRDELQGVIAHEIGHIHNLDVRFMTIASVTVGAITLLSEVFLRSLWYTGGGRRRTSRNDSGGGQGQAIIMIAALALMILAPISAELLYFACSRRREYLADACAARFTRYPEGLASALEKLSHAARPKSVSGYGAVAPLLIHNPPNALSLGGLTATHPPIEKRIEILRTMSGGADFAHYETAYRTVSGPGARMIGARSMAASEEVAIRDAEPSTGTAPLTDGILSSGGLAQARAVGDMLAGIGGYVFIDCPCGARIKVPPTYGRPQVPCMRCGTLHDIPRADPMPHPEPTGSDEPGKVAGTYKRKSNRWESFRCSCGGTVELSPNFAASKRACKLCGRVYVIDSSDIPTNEMASHT